MDDFIVSTDLAAGLTEGREGGGRIHRSAKPRRSAGRAPKRSGRDLVGRLVSAPVRFAATSLLAAVVCVVGTFSFGDRGLLAAEIAAGVISVNYAAGFARRIGGRAWAGALIALVISGAAIASNQAFLLSAAAIGTAVLGAVLGVIATRPAAQLFALVREILFATGIALIGGLAATAYRAPLNVDRAHYLALGISLVVTVALVYRLGSGLSGLGKRGWISLSGGALSLVVIVVYTEALTRWGSDSWRHSALDALTNIEQLIGAIPRPLIFVVGMPALIWGVASRARRREGWWLTAFGAVGLSVISTMFFPLGYPSLHPVLSLAYSITLGMFLGGILVAVDSRLGGRGRRTSDTAELARITPEPERHEPLI